MYNWIAMSEIMSYARVVKILIEFARILTTYKWNYFPISRVTIWLHISTMAVKYEITAYNFKSTWLLQLLNQNIEKHIGF